MFLKLNHQTLEAFQESRKMVIECYKLTKLFPADERFALISQIRRAALSVHLNIAEGASRKSEKERKRYYEISRSSIVEIDAAFDVANDLGYMKNLNYCLLGEKILKCFKLLTGLLNSEGE